MGMPDKDFCDIESAVDELLQSGLTDHQKNLLNRVIMVTYGHIHKSNKLVDNAQTVAERSVDSFEKLELYYAPVTDRIQ